MIYIYICTICTTQWNILNINATVKCGAQRNFFYLLSVVSTLHQYKPVFAFLFLSSNNNDYVLQLPVFWSLLLDVLSSTMCFPFLACLPEHHPGDQVQDQDTSRFYACRGPILRKWLLLLVSLHGGGQGPLWGQFIRATNPIDKGCHHELITSPKSHLLIPLSWGIRISTCEFGEVEAQIFRQ